MSNSVIEIICENCGARNKLGDKICANCGESSGLEIVPYIDKTKEEIVEEKAPIEETADEKQPFDDIDDIDILFGKPEEKPKLKKEGFFAKFLSKENSKKEKAKKEHKSELWDLEELLDAQNGNINKIEIETVEEPIVFSDAQKEDTIVNVETAIKKDVKAVGFEDNLKEEDVHQEIENHIEDMPRKSKPKYDFGDMGYARLGEELDIEPSVFEKKSKASIAMEVEDKADRVSAQEIQAEIEEQEMISDDKVDIEEIQAIEIPKEKTEKKVLRRFGQLEESSDEDITAKADKKVEFDIQPLPSYEQIRQERLERERLEKEKLERERLEQQRREELVRQEQERLERERLEQERLEQERLERERQAELARLEEERQRAEREEQERLERERLEQERLEQERLERERLEQAAAEAEKSSEAIESIDEKFVEEKVEPEKPKYDFSDMGYTQLGEYPKVKMSEHRKDFSIDSSDDKNESINIIEETPKKKRAFSIRETFFGRGKKAAEPNPESESLHSENQIEGFVAETKEETLPEQNILAESKEEAQEMTQSKEEKERSFLFKRAMPSESTRLRHIKPASEDISVKEDFKEEALEKSESESKNEPSLEQKSETQALQEEFNKEISKEAMPDNLSEEILQESSTEESLQEEIQVDESTLAEIEPKHERSSTIVAMSDFVEQMQNKNRELPQEEEKPSEMDEESISFEKIEHEITEQISDDQTSSEVISDENTSERIVPDEKISDRAVWGEEISAEEFYDKKISAEQIVSKEVFVEEISAKETSAEEISAEEISAEDFSSKENTEFPNFQTFEVPKEKESEPLFEEIALSSTSEEKIVESPWRENEFALNSNEIKFDEADEYEPVVVDFGDAKIKSSFESDFLTDVPVAPYTEPSTISDIQEPMQERVLGFTKDHLERFLGKNADYYIFKFNRMERSRNPISWSWSGFLFGETWLLYRKQYLIAALIYILATVTSFFVPQSSFVILGISRLLFGLLGNRIYYRYAKRELAEIDSMNDSYLQDIHIRVKGGTNIKAAIGYILLWAIFFGIMLAMALNLLPAPLGNLNLIL